MPAPDPAPADAADTAVAAAGPRPRGGPVPQPAKRRVVYGLLVGAALGGTLGAVNLAFSDLGDQLTADGSDPAGWHAAAARYTGGCVLGGGLIGLLGGAAAAVRDRLRGGRTEPPAGFDA